MGFPVDSSQPSKRSRLRKWLTGALIALVVLASPFVVMEVAFNIATAPMVAIADKMRPDPSWSEDGHNVAGGPFCIRYTVPCDSMWRAYRTEQHVTPADVQRISDEALGGANVEGDCETSPLPAGLTGAYTACSATGIIDGYDVEIKVLKLADYDDVERIIQFRLSSIKNR
ncbi:hypothetical protein [Cryobacterium mannosilyticum]|uniref:Uncharacterized protein n=1 Tax=Cryobacterium mannosilyticum TaxID=1259190 RepID=A0A4R8W7T9_9MICO|nr:hypothetical protein [Cryobacterium mannosilyticum]TFC03987.1 hypothetical protein E3O32_08940 [Cryobacterium mannosilyticum]